MADVPGYQYLSDPVYQQPAMRVSGGGSAINYEAALNGPSISTVPVPLPDPKRDLIKIIIGYTLIKSSPGQSSLEVAQDVLQALAGHGYEVRSVHGPIQA